MNRSIHNQKHLTLSDRVYIEQELLRVLKKNNLIREEKNV